MRRKQALVTDKRLRTSSTRVSSSSLLLSYKTGCLIFSEAQLSFLFHTKTAKTTRQDFESASQATMDEKEITHHEKVYLIQLYLEFHTIVCLFKIAQIFIVIKESNNNALFGLVEVHWKRYLY